MAISLETLTAAGVRLTKEQRDRFETAVSLDRSDLHDPAAQTYEQFLAMLPAGHPASFAGWWNRGDCLHALGRFDEALELFDRALGERKDLAGLWSSRGLSLAALGRMEDALESFREAVGRDARPIDRQYLAYALFDLGRHAEAGPVLAALAPEVDPAERPLVWARLAVSRAATGESSAEAVARVRTGLADRGADDWAEVGLLLARSGREAEAREVLAEALRRGPAHRARVEIERVDPSLAGRSPWDAAVWTDLGPAPNLDDWSLRQSLRFDATSRHLAWIDGEEEREIAVVDGVPREPAAEEIESLSVSASGAWAMAARFQSGWWLIADGERVAGPFEESPSLDLGPDGRLSAVLPEGEAARLLVGGELGPPFDRIGAVRFSRDGRRVAYVAWSGGEAWAVIDGVREGPYEGIAAEGLGFSPDGRRHAYVAEREGRQLVVLDGVPGPLYAGCAGLTWSGDSRRFVHWAGRDDGRGTAVLDGKEQGWVEELSDFRLDASGERFVHFARKKGRQRLVDRGRPGPDWDDAYDLSLAPDGSSLAYFAQKEGKWRCVQDGRESEPWDDVTSGSLAWNPVRSAWVYVAARGVRFAVVEGSVAGRTYDDLTGHPHVSARGRVAYAASRHGAAHVVLDGHESPPLDLVLAPTRFEGDDLHALGVRDGRLVRLEMAGVGSAP